MKIALKKSVVRRGFTLIEVVLAMGLMTALIILCARMAAGNLQLASGISKKQAAGTIKEGLFELLNQQFNSLPGNARLELIGTQGQQPYLYTITLQNVPLAFTWGGQEKIAKAIQIAGVKRRDGMLNIVMRYYENEILSDSDNVSNAKEEKPFAEVVLMEDVRFFEWEALDGRTMEWQSDWDLQGRLPLELKLMMATGANDNEMKQIFWIVPKVNPENLVNAIQQPQIDPIQNPGLPPINDPSQIPRSQPIPTNR
jgi:hypothetical protein